MTAVLQRVAEDKEEVDNDEKNGLGDIDISWAIGKFSLFSIHILLLTIFYYAGMTPWTMTAALW